MLDLLRRLWAILSGGGKSDPTPQAPPPADDSEYEGVEGDEPVPAVPADPPPATEPKPEPAPPPPAREPTFHEWLQAELTAAGIRHFSAHEVCPVGRRAGGSGPTLQPMPRDLLSNVLAVARVLEWLRAEAGGTPLHVTSWYRDPAYNRAVGGASASMHVMGGAADVRHGTRTPAQLRQLLERHPLSRSLGVGTYRSFVHADTRGLIGRAAPARW
jgi:hypothetical protein